MAKSNTAGGGEFEPTDTPAEVLYKSPTGRRPIDEVMNHILTGLIEGRIAPGDRVVADRLSKEVEVSIIPVREAIHFLAGEGVIELLPQRGARIRSMDADEIVDWWHIFRAISELGFEASAAAVTKDPSQCVHIARALEAIHRAQRYEEPVPFVLTLADFHRVLNQIANKPVYEDAIRRLQVVFWCTFLPDFIPFETYGRYFAEHYQVVGEAIMRGDGATASFAFRHHVAWSSAIIEGQRPEPGAPWVANGHV